MSHWSTKYLQIEYKKMNCSKFVEHVLRNQFGVEYTFPQSEGSVFNQSAQIKKHLPEFCVKTNHPKDGDLVLMHGARRMCHVGVFFKYNGQRYVLHTESSLTTAVCHKFMDLMEFGYRVEGVYTWLK